MFLGKLLASLLAAGKRHRSSDNLNLPTKLALELKKALHCSNQKPADFITGFMVRIRLYTNSICY